MGSIEFIRAEIERLRVQISRQQQDILTLQRSGLSTGLAEVHSGAHSALRDGSSTTRSHRSGFSFRDVADITP
jgi:hypothetical protein